MSDFFLGSKHMVCLLTKGSASVDFTVPREQSACHTLFCISDYGLHGISVPSSCRESRRDNAWDSDDEDLKRGLAKQDSLEFTRARMAKKKADRKIEHLRELARRADVDSVIDENSKVIKLSCLRQDNTIDQLLLLAFTLPYKVSYFSAQMSLSSAWSKSCFGKHSGGCSWASWISIVLNLRLVLDKRKWSAGNGRHPADTLGVQYQSLNSAAGMQVSAATILKSLAKNLDKEIVDEMEVAAGKYDIEDGSLKILSLSWYYNKTFYCTLES